MLDNIVKYIGYGTLIFAAFYGLQKYELLPKAAEMLKRAEMFKKADVVASTGIPLATNYGSISKVQTNTAISSGMALGQTVNYSASNLPDSSSWAADVRTVHAVGQNYGAALGQSVL